MNQLEFSELQNQVANEIYVYESFLKKGYLLDVEFKHYFHQYIEKEYVLMEENALLKKVIGLLKDKKGLDEVEKYIQQVKENYAKWSVNLSNKVRNCDIIFKKNAEISEDSAREFETNFKDFIRKYHPALKININQGEKQAYDFLKNFYFRNDHSGFFSFLKLNTKYFVEVSIDESKYKETSEYYYRLLEQIKIDMKRSEKSYPYTMADVFVDEMSIAREESEFRIRINRLQEMNKNIHKDFIAIYGEDITL